MDLKITGAKLSGDAEKDVKILANHVFQLEEQLRYQLRNLDVTNFNDLGLARYENGRLQVYTEQLDIRTEQLRIEIGEVGENYSSLSQTVDGIQTTVKSHTTTIDGHTSSINSQGKKITSLESSIKQTADKIEAVVSAVDDSNGNVTAASIVAAINNAGSTVKISADHIELVGEYVTFSDLRTAGKTTINGANIETGSISADAIYGGTLSGVRIESYGYPAWADPLAGAQEVTIEDGGISLSGVNLGRTFAGGFTIELTDGTKYEFASGGIYLNGSRIV